MGSREEVAELASQLRYGLYAHAAILQIARDPRATELAPAERFPGDGPSSAVTCKDGSTRPFYWHYALEQAETDPGLRDLMDRAWCTSSLILLGDRLADEDYFDRAPVLEMVRHVRNGVAHGNRFTILKASELAKWPAHNRHASCSTTEPLEITAELNGKQILFDFMGAGDVLDLLISVSAHLGGHRFG
jgi:hypothetical protein